MEGKEEVTQDAEDGAKSSGGRLVPVTVVYCGVCGLPAEYCEFGPSFEKCKPWLKEHCPGLYPDLDSKEEGPEESSESKNKRGGKGLVKASKDEGEPALLPGGKVKKVSMKEKPIVKIYIQSRTKKKHVTHVVGLDKFGIKLTDAKKVFSTAFASGSSVGKDEATGGEYIDIQGDKEDELVELLQSKWNISDDSIKVVHEKPKE